MKPPDSKARAPAADRPDDPRAARAAKALWVALGVLAAARIVLSFVPNMWGWGLNLLRFLDPATQLLPWLVAALALVPWIARRLERPFAAAGNALVQHTLAAFILAALIALLAWGSPDRVRYVGDFLIRQGTADQAGHMSVLFPQALPFDVFLHYQLPGALARAGVASANTTARLIGALDAALLALIAAAFVRALALRGAAAFAAWAVVVFGGYLGMFTGYSKAVCEVTALTAVIGVLVVRVARDGKGRLALGVALSLAIALHRSSLVLIPAAALAWALDARRERAPWRRPATWLAVAIPLAALATVLPRVVPQMIHSDVPILFAPTAVRGGGLGAAFSLAHVADVLNLVALLSPLALVAPLVAWCLGRVPLSGREWPVLLTLAGPLVIMLGVVHTPQGMFRDWDVFAETGVALSLIAAALVGETLRRAPARRWIGVAVVMGVAMPALQWLAHFTDPTMGIERVKAYLIEPPARLESDLATSWDFVGISSFRLKHWDDAALAWSQAADIAPSRRILDQWMRADLMRGDLRGAQDVLHRIVAQFPADAQAWIGLAAVTSRIPDLEDSRRAVKRALELRPVSREALEIEKYLEKNYPRHR